MTAVAQAGKKSGDRTVKAPYACQHVQRIFERKRIGLQRLRTDGAGHAPRCQEQAKYYVVDAMSAHITAVGDGETSEADGEMDNRHHARELNHMPQIGCKKADHGQDQVQPAGKSSICPFGRLRVLRLALVCQLDHPFSDLHVLLACIRARGRRYVIGSL